MMTTSDPLSEDAASPASEPSAEDAENEPELQRHSPSPEEIAAKIARHEDLAAIDCNAMAMASWT